MKIIRNVDTYAPAHIGQKDILVEGHRIIAIEDHIEANITGITIEEIDGTGKIASPGFIDAHFLLLGGGGENGFQISTTEVKLTVLTNSCVTTCSGLLGTYCVGLYDFSLLSQSHT